MNSEEKKWKSELLQFRKTSVFEHLEKRRSEKMRTRMAQLIDLGLASTDLRVKGLAQSLREEALFWSEIIEIVDTEDATPVASRQIVDKMFRDFEDPRNAETQVALGAIGG